MRFLIDQNRSPRLAELLREAGHDAVHTLDIGLERTEDGGCSHAPGPRIVCWCPATPTLVRCWRWPTTPRRQLILFRQRVRRRAESQAEVLVRNFDELAPALEAGAVVIIEDEPLRIRRLPLIPPDE